MKNTLKNQTYIGERALFMSDDLSIFNCVFENGESPLKESQNLEIYNSEFRWKYPLWYCDHVKCKDVTLIETARSGIWYTNDIQLDNCTIDAPKTFRRCDGVKINSCTIKNAQETLWKCKNVVIKNVEANGEYFGFNSENIEVDHLLLNGNYCFDGGKNVVVRNSILNSKDSFWNTENVLVCDSVINGEYLGWNSVNMTFVNCKIISHQGLCYIKKLKMINCELIDSDLVFEYCEDLDCDIKNKVTSIKNPISGVIKVKGVEELILDDKNLDNSFFKIIDNE